MHLPKQLTKTLSMHWAEGHYLSTVFSCKHLSEEKDLEKENTKLRPTQGHKSPAQNLYPPLFSSKPVSSKRVRYSTALLDATKKALN